MKTYIFNYMLYESLSITMLLVFLCVVRFHFGVLWRTEQNDGLFRSAENQLQTGQNYGLFSKFDVLVYFGAFW